MELRRLLTTNLSGLVLGQNYDTGKPQKTVAWKGPRYSRRRLRALDLLYVTDQLGGLVRANAPMVSGITDALSLDAPNAKVEAILLTLRDDLQAGMSLADAMRLRPRFFPGGYVDLVSAGEDSGTLADVFTRLSDDLDRELEAGGTWVGYIAYAAIVVTIQINILAFIATKVSPVFAELLGDFDDGIGAHIPWALVALMEAGDFLTNYWRGLVMVLVLYLAIAMVIYVAGGWSILSGFFGGVAAHIPLVRGWVRKRQLATVSMYLSRVLAAGVPLAEALARVERLSVSNPLKRAFARVRTRIENGESLHDALEANRRAWPRSFVSWLALGESSAMLPEAFEELGDNYRQQCHKAKAMTARIVAPLTILLGGAFSLLGAAACYQTMTALVYAMLDTM
jgi:type IV pilus assembly protein PilC